MSVKSFLNELEDCDINFPNEDIDDFVTCIKRLGKILTRCFDNSSASKRERRYNSVLAREMSSMDKYNVKKVFNLYTFSANSCQIDICIRANCYWVSISGAWRPDMKLLNSSLDLCNLNFKDVFEYPDVKKIYSVNGSIQYFGGEDFPVNIQGFNRIARLWAIIVSQLCCHIDVQCVTRPLENLDI